MKFSVLLPYKEAAKYHEKWAEEEEGIDFQNDIFAAKRCTLSFAAEELCVYLKRLGHEASVCDEVGENTIFIDSQEGDAEAFTISGDIRRLELYGEGRSGALYAVYELLEAQGIRWYSPVLEYVPRKPVNFVLPKLKHYQYDFPQGRGFHMECVLKESRMLILWMARNRMNFHACHAHSHKYQQKLCMRFGAGGHIFEKLLDPKNIEADGRYYIDAHLDWYGKREEAITLENAQRVQFCVSNKELLDRIAQSVIDRIKTQWTNEDMLEIAGFDTWGRSCNCEECRKIGNGSDIALHYLSHIRKRMNEAEERGEIRRGVRLYFDAYDGTDTITAPENPIPENLKNSGDHVMFCTILRCFQHDIDDESCDRNRDYKRYLDDWLATGFPVAMNEYFNVSRFEELPLVFLKRIHHDIRYYIEKGVERFVYMHVPMVEWGVCATTQYLLANMTRDKDCDYEALVTGYFQNIFGEYADEVRNAYEKMEKATELCASWRSWGEESILQSLLGWDGKMPRDRLFADAHLKGIAPESGYQSVRLMKEAVEILRSVRERELERIAGCEFGENRRAVNPIEERNMASPTVLLDKLCEDIRGILYGIDMQEFMALLVDYHDSLYERAFSKARTLLERIRVLGTKMSEDTFGVSFMEYADLEVRDLLKRSRLKSLYYQCLANESILEG